MLKPMLRKKFVSFIVQQVKIFTKRHMEIK